MPSAEHEFARAEPDADSKVHLRELGAPSLLCEATAGPALVRGDPTLLTRTRCTTCFTALSALRPPVPEPDPAPTPPEP